MTKQNPLQNILTSLLAVTLLGFYLSADLVGSLHSYFFHEEQSETVCSLENEKDACHRTIYHHDTVNGCNHSFHLIKPIAKCELCSILLTHHVLPSKGADNTYFVNHVPVIPSLEDQLVTNPVCAAHGLRGPPFLS
ncbi:MAG: hypothetical protein KDC79_00650 [Cyclobacteriaceae bacterium]|nr:hypothetical protein [Cyclobacteriaceae bacterium]